MLEGLDTASQEMDQAKVRLLLYLPNNYLHFSFLSFFLASFLEASNLGHLGFGSKGKLKENHHLESNTVCSWG
jgi:hypothetical protein